MGFLPGQNVAPTFETEVEGTYRLNLRLYSSLTDEQSPLGKDLVPLLARAHSKPLVAVIGLKRPDAHVRLLCGPNDWKLCGVGLTAEYAR